MWAWRRKLRTTEVVIISSSTQVERVSLYANSKGLGSVENVGGLSVDLLIHEKQIRCAFVAIAF
jgi:hypothetical protein